ncbi:hypothetical protein A5697_12785 [Mycobacterium sp. E3251]|nr:hypothetical protein A5697_12785 [Mycobacterium sp. E3251]
MQFRAVRDRREPGGLGETHQFRWDGHGHVVPSAQQLAADRCQWLDVAARSVAGEGEFRHGS